MPNTFVPQPRDVIEPAWEIVLNGEQTLPLILASPHSGRVYPPDFVSSAQLTPQALRKSEDAYIDDVFMAATEIGVPMLRAHFPRAYVDPNRPPWELDPEMFTDPLPDYVTTQSPYLSAGLGTVPRVVASGEEIYQGKLTFDAARWRMETYYDSYHAALEKLVCETLQRFSVCLLVDCHSMPSSGPSSDRNSGIRRPDMVLGDRHRRSCNRSISRLAEEQLRGMGYRVTSNDPYAGGYCTQHYGDPARHRHALQIEVNRDLYLDETTIEPTPKLATLRGQMRGLVEDLATLMIKGLP